MSQDITQKERLTEFVQETRETADKIEAEQFRNEDHANGVAIGLRWAADELEAILNEQAAETK